MAQKNSYIAERDAMRKAHFEAGVKMGRQQIVDMVSLVLRDPKYVEKDIHGKGRLLKIVMGIDEYIGKYEKAWSKDDETDYYRAKLDAALAEAYGEGLHDSFLERYEFAPEYDYKKGKWK